MLNGSKSSGDRFIGDVAAGNELVYRKLRLDGVRRVTVRIASGGAGGGIELRLDRADGPVLASFKVEPTGGWDQWTELAAECSPTQGDHDLVVRFTHPQGQGGLMNLDWVHLGKGQ